MTDESGNSSTPEGRHVSRLELLWDVVVFQFKLAFDGVRDILLVPLSIFSAILGLAAGGDEPDRYFKQLLRFGRRTDAWLNLFGRRSHGKTSDKLIRPLQAKVFAGVRSNPWLNKAGAGINRRLDSVNASVASATRSTSPGKKSSHKTSRERTDP